jgi:hypothetical protein
LYALLAQHAWTHRNQLYGGMYEALRGCEAPWYIASSKARQRVTPLLTSLLGVRLEPDSPRLLAGLIPPTERKVEALRCAPSLATIQPACNVMSPPSARSRRCGARLIWQHFSHFAMSRAHRAQDRGAAVGAWAKITVKKGAGGFLVSTQPVKSKKCAGN